MECKVLKNGKCEITQNYGENNHSGVDLVGENYTIDRVVAHSSGVVSQVVTGHVNEKGSTGNDSYGNYVVIDHKNGFKTLYAHMNNIIVEVGQEVRAGKILGDMGDSGNAYGVHLHFQVFHYEQTINANYYIDKEFEDEQPEIKEDEQPEIKEDIVLLNLVKKTIRGDYGNGEERKIILGGRYSEVQNQVNLNYQNGTINWDNVRLY